MPNILSKAGYAETVYVSVLLSAISLADLGMSLVYTRAVPSLVASGQAEETRRWDETVLGFGTICAALFSAGVVALYVIRYGNAVSALLLLPIPLLTFWGSFHVVRVNARGEFHEYRTFIIARSLGSLTAIPFAWLVGATGWFAGQFVAALTIIVRIGSGLRPFQRIDWEILRLYLFEGILLALVSVAWLQLLNFARLYASIVYPSDVIATYGVATAAYQSLAALVISGFLPVTVDILRRFGTSPADAYERVTALLRRAGPWGLAGTLIAAEAAPFVLPLLFPAYVFDPRTVFALVFSVTFYPFFIGWGNCLVGLRRAATYAALILLALGSGFVLAYAVDRLQPFAGAAFAQFAVLAIYPALLLAAVMTLAPGSRRALAGGAKTYLLVLALAAAYIALRWIWPPLGH